MDFEAPYPRPRFVRPLWQSLNGTWEFQFDDRDEGLDARWQNDGTLSGSIRVPFPYQAPLSGIGAREIHEVVWYARSFEVPEEWLKGELLLHFGAVDYETQVWINGQEVGQNRGGHVPFSFEIGGYLRAGAGNRVVLRVIDRQDPHQPRGKQSSSGLAHGIDYYCTTGIWQTVWIEPVPRLRIADLEVTPSAALSDATLRVQLDAPPASRELEIEVSAPGWGSIIRTYELLTSIETVDLTIPDARQWSPEDPFLYDLRVCVRQAGAVLDEVRSYFALRWFGVRDGRVELNGRPLYLKSVLDQGYWPESYLASPTDEHLRADVLWCKQFGFNSARKHQKVEDPRWLYWCDRLGLIVWAEMANTRPWSPAAAAALTDEWRRAVLRDRGHPCIMAWVPVNESWGAPGLREGHPTQAGWVRELVRLTRHLDPTRLVVDNDGWEHTEQTDLMTLHDYSHTGERLRSRYPEGVGCKCRVGSGQGVICPARVESASGAATLSARGAPDDPGTEASPDRRRVGARPRNPGNTVGRRRRAHTHHR